MNALGRWRLVEIIGRGAAGTVWRATDSTRTVTIKIADRHDEKSRRSLAHEARVLASFEHSNTPRLLDTFDDPPALVLDAAPAETFGDLLARGALWTIPLAARLDALSTVAEVLDDLHALGIIHRDVKPAHITATPPIMLFDFGVAQIAGAGPEPDAGTAAYMPPSAEPIASSRDAYAFAITAYEMLFGAHPLLTAADRDIVPAGLRRRAAAKFASDAWRRPSRIPRPELPPDLRAADLHALDKLFKAALGEPHGRPASLAPWMRELRACIPSGALSEAPETMPEAFGLAHTAHEVAAGLLTDHADAANWRAAVVIFAVILLIALAAVALRPA